MKVLVIDNSPEHEEYNDPLISAVEQFGNCTRLPYGEVAEDHSKLQEFSAVILSGVPIDYDFESIDDRQQEIEWIKETTVPVLGICLGHQSIGKVFGATVKDTEAETGSGVIRVVKDDPVFEGLGKKFVVETFHRASINVPKGFNLLASSRGCKNQVMRHNELPIYGFQFHPEHSDGGAGMILLKNFVEMAGEPEQTEQEVIDLTRAHKLVLQEEEMDLAA